MINLVIKNDGVINDMLFSKENNIIYRNLNQVLTLYRNFDEVINEKNENIIIKIGEKRVTSREYILINLIDFQTILDSVKYKRGNILYEYISILFENLDFGVQIETNLFLEKIFGVIQKEFCFNSHISFEDNLFKIFNSCADFKPIINDSEIVLKIQEILDYIIKIKMDKKFIIFINSEYLKIDINKNDNIFILDINSDKPMNQYNIIFLNEIQNFDINILLDNIKLNWPINYIDSEVEQSLGKYFKFYYNKEIVDDKDEKVLIIAKMINKMYDFNQKIVYSDNCSNNIIKSFLDNFKKLCYNIYRF